MDTLVKAVIDGKKGAATKFYKTYVRVIVAFLKNKLPNENEVEEVCQDVFLAAFESLPLYKGEAQIKTWLLSIAKHEVADFYRRKFCKKTVQFSGKLSENLSSELDNPERIFANKLKQERIEKTLLRIEKRYQQILIMRYEFGLSVKEIAYRLSLNFKAAESLLYRARISFTNTYAGI